MLQALSKTNCSLCLPPTVKQATCRRNGSLRKMDSAFFFVFDFSNPQTLHRVTISNYVTVVFEAGPAVHSLQKIEEKAKEYARKHPVPLGRANDMTHNYFY